MPEHKITVRMARVKDIPAIIELCSRVYPTMPTYSKTMLKGQITHFPDGHLVVEIGDEIVAYSASILISERKALRKHTWKTITGNGYATTHDDNGEYLYGYETMVDSSIRGNRIGQRIYDARKRIVKHYRLKGIVFAGRIPGWIKKKNKVKDVMEYVELVQKRKFRDPTLSFQLRNGFEVLGLLQDYLPEDRESGGVAVHLVWKNPEYQAESSQRSSILTKNVVRICTVQYQQRGIKSFADFAKMVEYFVDVASHYSADFVLFPEYFSMQLLSIENEKVPPHIAIEHMTKYTERIKDLLQKLAVRYNINVVGGSHPTKVDESVFNIAYICLRDGEVHQQEKIHPTPDERYWWNVEGGRDLNVVQTDCGPIGVLICYDSEFPELSRHFVNQGVRILFVPFLTDERKSYLRVRYCCHARAVENQIYVVMSGNVGNLPKVHNMDIQYAQSCILTPCDFAFSPEGVAADTTPNVEMVAFADLRMDILLEARNSGTVQNLKDRRHDLYTIVWNEK